MLLTMTRVYKTELDLNNEQTTACRKHAGAARWAYNWGSHASRRRIAQRARLPRQVTCTGN
jgi:hypothetical protein